MPAGPMDEPVTSYVPPHLEGDPVGNYVTGHVKRDPDTGAVAVRTGFPDEEPFTRQAWLVATTNNGAHPYRTAEVEAWDDLFVPPAAETGVGS